MRHRFYLSPMRIAMNFMRRLRMVFQWTWGPCALQDILAALLVAARAFLEACRRAMVCTTTSRPIWHDILAFPRKREFRARGCRTCGNIEPPDVFCANDMRFNHYAEVPQNVVAEIVK